MPKGTMLLYFLGLILILYLMPGIFNSGEPILLPNYNEFEEFIEDKNISLLKIYPDGTVEGSLFRLIDGVNKFRITLPEKSGMKIAEHVRKISPDTQIKFLQPKSGGQFYTLLFYVAIIAIFIFFIRSNKGPGGAMNSFIKSKAKLANPTDVKKTFADVAGIDEAKEELLEIIDFLKNPMKYSQLGAEIPNGILLEGPPGCGKTLLAQATAGEAGVPFFSESGSNFVEMFVGVGAGRVRDLFETAKKRAPCIVFIDEIDAMGRQRGAGLGGGNDEREQTLNALLTEMSGFSINQGIIVLAATNRPDVLDPALTRAGRFSRKVVVNRPDLIGRVAILNIHEKNKPMSEDVNMEIIARGTPGFTGADLADLLNEAALHAAKEDRPELTMIDIEFAKDKVMMGSERKSTIMTDEEKNIIAFHEAGHTIVAMLTDGADPVHKVTIIPHGFSLGATWQLPLEDKHIHQENYLIGRLAIMMGGRMAEKSELSILTTGAENDINEATDTARRMVCSWGMSSLGPVRLEEDPNTPFLGRSAATASKYFSETTAQKVDEEIRKLLKNASATAEKIIQDNRDKLRIIAEALRNKETLNAEELKEIMDKL